MTTQTNQLTCSEQIALLPDIQMHPSYTQHQGQITARGWNSTLVKLVPLFRAHAKGTDADIAQLEARVASLESHLAKAVEAAGASKAKKQPKAE